MQPCDTSAVSLLLSSFLNSLTTFKTQRCQNKSQPNTHLLSCVSPSQNWMVYDCSSFTQLCELIGCAAASSTRRFHDAIMKLLITTRLFHMSGAAKHIVE